MVGFLKLISVRRKEVSTGFISQRASDGRFSVSVKGKSVRASSAIGSVAPGERVLLASVGGEFTIFGKRTAQGKVRNEVRVSG